MATINAGSTAHRPARRGTGTFTPLHLFDGRRTIAEVTVEDGVPDIAAYVIDIEHQGTTRLTSS